MVLTTFIQKIQQSFAQNMSPVRLLAFFDTLQRSIYLDNTYDFEYSNEEDVEMPHILSEEDKLTYIVENGTLRNSNGDLIQLEKFGTPVIPVKVLGVYLDPQDINGEMYSRYWLGDSPYITTGSTKLGYRSTPKTATKSPAFTLDEKLDKDTKMYVRLTITPEPVVSLESSVLVDIDRFELQLTDGMVGLIEREINGASNRYNLWIGTHVPTIRGYYNTNISESHDLIPNRQPF